MCWLLRPYQQRLRFRKDPFQSSETNKGLVASPYQASIEKEKKKKTKTFFLALDLSLWNECCEVECFVPHNFIATLPNNRWSAAHPELSEFFSLSPWKPTQSPEPLQLPDVSSLLLCCSFVWGAFPDTICLRNGFQPTVFWSDPPVRASPTPPSPHRPHAGRSSPRASPYCPERRRQLKPGKEP